MYLLWNTSTDAAWNLALEEYALTSLRREILMLWRNSSAVIIGKNQNALEEIDLDYVRDHDIAVIRRQSGGGAVFHDLGNINFTMIGPMEEGDFSNYRKFTEPICGFLHSLGVAARLSGRNDLTIDGMKFSGNAQAVKAGYIMHHGTILYNADVSRLAGALRPPKLKLESKGVRSVRSRVTNVADHIPSPLSAEDFLRQLYRYFLDQPGREMEEYRLTHEDRASVRQLVEEKYGTWEWNFGASPPYDLESARRFSFGTVQLRLRVKAGRIDTVRVYGDFFGQQDVRELESLLEGIPHTRSAVSGAIAGLELSRYIAGITAEEFLPLVFPGPAGREP